MRYAGMQRARTGVEPELDTVNGERHQSEDMIDFEQWGLIDYDESTTRQQTLVEQIKRGDRRSTLVFCQHPTVITVGRATEDGHILTPPAELKARGISVVENNRGGDVTVHNPGQLVGYPIFHLSHYREDLHWFLREIEECIIQTVEHFGIQASRVEGLTGVWVEETRKICAIGIHCSRWVTSHGFALNVENRIEDFNHIVPCGIQDRSVTSISKELECITPISDVEKICKTFFLERF